MKFLRQILILALPVLITLACQINVGGPQSPYPPIPLSPDAALQFEQVVASALQPGPTAGTFAFTLSEEQMTSFIARKLQEQPDPVLNNPQVYLRNGQIDVYGLVQRDWLLANVHLTLKAEISADGKPQVKMVSSDLGPLPLPTGFLDSFTSLIEEMTTGSFGTAATGIKLENISISDGMLTVTGKLR